MSIRACSFVFLTVLASIGTASCVAPDSTGAAQLAIVGGADSTSDDDSAVLIISHDPSRDSGGNMFYEFCTGTLVAPNLVLTARHCLSALDGTDFTCTQSGMVTAGTGATIGVDFPVTDTMVFVGNKLPDTFTKATASAVGKQVVHDSSTTVCNEDLALVVLARQIVGAKITVLRLDGAVTPNEAVYAVGWGATLKGPLPSVRQRRDDVTVDVVGPSDTQFRFDELGDHEFRVTESICKGDSGGPVYDDASHAQIGVVTRGFSGNGAGPACAGTEHTITRVSGFKDLILEGFTAAGATPTIEATIDMATATTDMAVEPAPSGGCDASGTGASPSSICAELALILACVAFASRRRD